MVVMVRLYAIVRANTALKIEEEPKSHRHTIRKDFLERVRLRKSFGSERAVPSESTKTLCKLYLSPWNDGGTIAIVCFQRG